MFLQDYFKFNDDIGFSFSLLLSTICFFLFLKIENKSPLKFLKLYNVDFKFIPLIILLAISLVLFKLGLGNLLIEILKINITIDTSIYDELYFWSIIHIVFLAPICEEIFFRGIIFTKLRYILPNSLAILIQALIFGAFHGGLSGDIVRVSLSTVSGIIFALLYNYTNNLTSSILFHSCSNILVIILNLLAFDINPILSIIISFLCLVLYTTLIKYNKK